MGILYDARHLEPSFHKHPLTLGQQMRFALIRVCGKEHLRTIHYKQAILMTGREKDIARNGREFYVNMLVRRKKFNPIKILFELLPMLLLHFALWLTTIDHRKKEPRWINAARVAARVFILATLGQLVAAIQRVTSIINTNLRRYFFYAKEHTALFGWCVATTVCIGAGLAIVLFASALIPSLAPISGFFLLAGVHLPFVGALAGAILLKTVALLLTGFICLACLQKMVSDSEHTAIDLIKLGEPCSTEKALRCIEYVQPSINFSDRSHNRDKSLSNYSAAFTQKYFGSPPHTLVQNFRRRDDFTLFGAPRQDTQGFWSACKSSLGWCPTVSEDNHSPPTIPTK